MRGFVVKIDTVSLDDSNSMRHAYQTQPIVAKLGNV